jgi:PAS domain S-box-containing protein
MEFSGEHVKQVKKELNFTGVHPDDIGLLKKRAFELVENGGVLRHSFRVFSDRKNEYRWILLEGSMRQDGAEKILYGIFSDISEQMQMEKELAVANEKMEDIINAIPGGVAIYKVTDIFETVYFSDGVPELSGYTVEEYNRLIERDAVEMTYWEDTDMVVSRAREVIETHEVADFEFRKQHRDGHIVWVHAQAKWIGEDGGAPLLHCVFHNITDSKEAQLEMDHLVNSIPGGIATYRVDGEKFKAAFLSDGVIALSGHTREEYEEIIRDDATNNIYDQDRKRVYTAMRAAVKST